MVRHGRERLMCFGQELQTQLHSGTLRKLIGNLIQIPVRARPDDVLALHRFPVLREYRAINSWRLGPVTK